MIIYLTSYHSIEGEICYNPSENIFHFSVPLKDKDPVIVEIMLLFSPSLISPNSFSFSSYETKTSIYTVSINGINGFALNTAPIASITESLFFFTVEMYPLMRQKERAP